jgi:hypothetical protein
LIAPTNLQLSPTLRLGDYGQKSSVTLVEKDLGATKTIEHFVARAVRLYEQEQGESFGSPLLGLYVRRWVSWVNAGLKNINLTARWDIQLNRRNGAAAAVSYAEINPGRSDGPGVTIPPGTSVVFSLVAYKGLL